MGQPAGDILLSQTGQAEIEQVGLWSSTLDSRQGVACSALPGQADFKQVAPQLSPCSLASPRFNWTGADAAAPAQSHKHRG